MKTPGWYIIWGGLGGMNTPTTLLTGLLFCTGKITFHPNKNKRKAFLLELHVMMMMGLHSFRFILVSGTKGVAPDGAWLQRDDSEMVLFVDPNRTYAPVTRVDLEGGNGNGRAVEIPPGLLAHGPGSAKQAEGPTSELQGGASSGK